MGKQNRAVAYAIKNGAPPEVVDAIKCLHRLQSRRTARQEVRDLVAQAMDDAGAIEAESRALLDQHQEDEATAEEVATYFYGPDLDEWESDHYAEREAENDRHWAEWLHEEDYL